MIREHYEMTLETTLNILSIHEYATDSEAYILNALGNIFMHKCFDRQYILKIVRIIKKSACEIYKSNLDSFGTVNVTFMAKVLYLNIGDILPNVTLISDVMTTYIGDYNYIFTDAETKKVTKERIAVAIQPIPKKNFKLDWIMPVVIIENYFSPMQSVINAYSCLLSAEYFNLTKKIWRVDKSNSTLEMNEIISQKLKNIKVELELRTKSDIRAESIVFFEKLFYPMKNITKTNTKWDTYEGGQPWQGPPSATFTKPLISIVNAVNLVSEGKEQNFTGVWTRPLELHRSSPMIQKMSADDITTVEPLIVETTATVMVSEVLSEILEIIKLIRMMAIYYDEATISAQSGLWQIIEDLKY